MWAQALCTSRVTMTVHNDKSHTIADDTAAMISNTAAPAAPATYWHGRPLDDVRRQPPSNPCAPFGPLRPARCSYHTQRWPAQPLFCAPSDPRCRQVHSEVTRILRLDSSKEPSATARAAVEL